jgi:hypothetical protein
MADSTLPEACASSIFKRLWGRPRRDWLLLSEALVVLTIASLAIRIVPFRQLAAAAGRKGQVRALEDPEVEATLKRIRWAIGAAACRVPWKAVCIQRGFATHFLLRRRLLASELHYGIRRGEGSHLKSHVWVTSAGAMVVGGEVADEYACVATFTHCG